MMSSWTSVAVWMNSTTEAYSTARSPGVAAQARRHQQHRRAHALAAALLDVAAHLGDQRHARLDVPDEFPLDAARDLRGSARRSAPGPQTRGVLRGIAQGNSVRLSDLTILNSVTRSVNALSRCRVASCPHSARCRASSEEPSEDRDGLPGQRAQGLAAKLAQGPRRTRAT